MSSPTGRSEYIWRVVAAIALTAAGVALVWGVYLARHALLLVYVSVLFAIGFGPVVHAIEHHRWLGRGARRLPRWAAILIVYVTLIGVLVGIGLLVVPPIVKQGQELSTRLPELVEKAQQFFVDRGLLERPYTLQEAVRRVPQGPGTAVGTAAVAVTWTATVIVETITVLILTFYLLVDSEAISAAFARFFPREERPRLREASEKITTKLSAWLTGQLILSATIGSTAAIGLWLLGVPYFYVLAVIAAIGELIPMLGPLLSAIPAILAALTVSPQVAIGVAVFWLVQQQVENNVLVPKIMERQVGVSPVTVIVALLVGGSVLGVLGAILAVPTAAIVQVVVLELMDDRP
jgi:predicted PurR-regulated permease PerM